MQRIPESSATPLDRGDLLLDVLQHQPARSANLN